MSRGDKPKYPLLAPSHLHLAGSPRCTRATDRVHWGRTSASLDGLVGVRESLAGGLEVVLCGIEMDDPGHSAGRKVSSPQRTLSFVLFTTASGKEQLCGYLTFLGLTRHTWQLLSLCPVAMSSLPGDRIPAWYDLT